MDDCIFCKIVKKELPCYQIYEDDKYLAFLDIFPRVSGHALVIPKKHYRWVYDVPEYGEYFETAKNVALGIQKALDSRYISFVTLGDEVHHAHIHILPQNESLKGVRFASVDNFAKANLEQTASEIKI